MQPTKPLQVFDRLQFQELLTNPGELEELLDTLRKRCHMRNGTTELACLKAAWVIEELTKQHGEVKWKMTLDQST